jgi:hypothetical protein
LQTNGAYGYGGGKDQDEFGNYVNKGQIENDENSININKGNGVFQNPAQRDQIKNALSLNNSKLTSEN